MSSFDYVVAGAGLFGATFARVATDAGKRVLVVENRDRVGGNCSTTLINGIHVHDHGPHIFHCNDEQIWRFVTRFATFNGYTHRVKSRSGGQVLSLPVNLMTFQQLFGTTSRDEALEVLERERVVCQRPRNLEEWALSQVGRTIYDRLIRGYTKKQWGRDPSILPATIIKRIPIRLTWDDNYFNDRYQGIPVEGYSSLIDGLLDGIEVRLGVDFNVERIALERLSHRTVYTGPIDAFYGHKLGSLAYRTLRFDTQVLEQPDFQGIAQMNYASESVPWTRIVEHRHFTSTQASSTVVTKEFPEEWTPGAHPYYPVNDADNDRLYECYRLAAYYEPRTIFGGRLAKYQYLDMDQTIGAALALARRERITK